MSSGFPFGTGNGFGGTSGLATGLAGTTGFSFSGVFSTVGSGLVGVSTGFGVAGNLGRLESDLGCVSGFGGRSLGDFTSR